MIYFDILATTLIARERAGRESAWISVIVLSIESKQSILFAIGINHRTAPVDLRERIYVHPHEVPQLLAELKGALSEAVVLSTCNRTEIYGVTDRDDLGLDHYKDLLIEFKGAGGFVGREHFFGAVSCAACQQLFRVATSVDSKIVGDTQILGQLRDAYALAKSHKATGKIINQLFQRSFKTGKRALTETRLHRGAVSVSLAAVELAETHFGGLSERTALVIGAGDTARLAAEALVKRRVGRLIVANRTIKRAGELIGSLKKIETITAEAVGFDALQVVLPNADLIICSTSSPEPVLRRSDLERHRFGAMIFDLAVPRDVAADVSEMDGLELRNIDDLNLVVNKNYRRRLDDLPAAKRIVMTEMTDFLVWYYSLPLLPAPMAGGRKPDVATQQEIVKTKKFLMANVSAVHKLAMNDGAETFAGHTAVVERLVRMKEAAFAAE